MQLLEVRDSFYVFCHWGNTGERPEEGWNKTYQDFKCYPECGTRSKEAGIAEFEKWFLKKAKIEYRCLALLPVLHSLL